MARGKGKGWDGRLRGGISEDRMMEEEEVWLEGGYISTLSGEEWKARGR